MEPMLGAWHIPGAREKAMSKMVKPLTSNPLLQGLEKERG